MSAITATETDLRDRPAQVIDEAWTRLNDERNRWLENSKEARVYLTQRTTMDTEVGQALPWKNKTSIPKLTQIADTLHSFYMAALVPSQQFFKWEGRDANSHRKANLIQQWMMAKVRMGGFRDELEKIIRDWIFYGNAFGGVEYVNEKETSLVDQREIQGFVGPRMFRISPLDCVIDPQANSFDDSIFIRRYMVPIVDIIKHNERFPNIPYDEAAIEKVKEVRQSDPPKDLVDMYKDIGLQVDGFDSYQNYLQSQYVDILEYWGDFFDPETGEVHENQVITVADRMFELRRAPNPSWSGRKPFFHVGWRILPDNLYGQGPVDNLVGIQYRIDHLENLKADAFDQIVHPMLAIIGDDIEGAEGFQFGPGEKLLLPAGADVKPIRPDTTSLNADTQIAMYMRMMEEMAGAPREAAGFRTPGEKSAFEVSVLNQGAERMFQDKLDHFESIGMTRVLNMMFEIGVRNMDPLDIVRTFNDDTGALELLELSREDVVADGVFKPTGAKHFEARNRRVQEMQGFLQLIQQLPSVGRHISGLKIAQMLERELGFQQDELVEENIAFNENMKAQVARIISQQQVQQIASTVVQSSGGTAQSAKLRAVSSTAAGKPGQTEGQQQ